MGREEKEIKGNSVKKKKKWDSKTWTTKDHLELSKPVGRIEQ